MCFSISFLTSVNFSVLTLKCSSKMIGWIPEIHFPRLFMASGLHISFLYEISHRTKIFRRSVFVKIIRFVLLIWKCNVCVLFSTSLHAVFQSKIGTSVTKRRMVAFDAMISTYVWGFDIVSNRLIFFSIEANTRSGGIKLWPVSHAATYYTFRRNRQPQVFSFFCHQS